MAIFGQKFLFQPNCLAGIGTMSHFLAILKNCKNHFTLLCKLKSGFLFQPNTVNDVFGSVGVLGAKSGHC